MLHARSQCPELRWDGFAHIPLTATVAAFRKGLRERVTKELSIDLPAAEQRMCITFGNALIEEENRNR